MRWRVAVVAAVVLLGGPAAVGFIMTVLFLGEDEIEITTPGELPVQTEAGDGRVVRVFIGDELTVDGEVVGEAELREALAALQLGEGDRAILRVEDTVAFGRLNDAKDALDALGVNTVIEVVPG